MEERKELQDEWFEYAERDLISARILFNNRGPATTIGLLIQQAVEKYLKGFLIGKGWRLKKTHDIELLLTEAAQYDERFREYLALGREISAFYAEERYPSGTLFEYSTEKMKQVIETSERLINMILKYK